MATLTDLSESLITPGNRFATTSTLLINPTGIEVRSNAISNLENELRVIWERLDSLQLITPEFVELSCKNCGGKIQQKYKDPILKCPYCKTVYAIGIKQVNA